MATQAVLTKQMPYVGTPVQSEITEALAESLETSKAAIMRYCMNKAFGLVGVGALPPGVTVDQVVARMIVEIGTAALNPVAEPVEDAIA